MPCGPDQPMIHAFAKRRNSPVGHEILAEDKGHDMLAEYRAGFWKYISVLCQNPALSYGLTSKSKLSLNILTDPASEQGTGNVN
jgi:hypothetical protein